MKFLSIILLTASFAWAQEYTEILYEDLGLNRYQVKIRTEHNLDPPDAEITRICDDAMHDYNGSNYSIFRVILYFKYMDEKRLPYALARYKYGSRYKIEFNRYSWRILPSAKGQKKKKNKLSKKARKYQRRLRKKHFFQVRPKRGHSIKLEKAIQQVLKKAKVPYLKKKSRKNIPEVINKIKKFSRLTTAENVLETITRDMRCKIVISKKGVYLKKQMLSQRTRIKIWIMSLELEDEKFKWQEENFDNLKNLNYPFRFNEPNVYIAEELDITTEEVEFSLASSRKQHWIIDIDRLLNIYNPVRKKKDIRHNGNKNDSNTPLGVPREIMDKIKARAATRYPNSFNTQKTIIEMEREAYIYLNSSNIPSGIPRKIMDKIKAEAATRYPNSFNTQKTIIEMECEAYIYLNSSNIPSGIPREIMDKIKAKVATRYPNSFNTQKTIIEMKCEAYLDINK